MFKNKLLKVTAQTKKNLCNYQSNHKKYSLILYNTCLFSCTLNIFHTIFSSVLKNTVIYAYEVWLEFKLCFVHSAFQKKITKKIPYKMHTQEA